MGFDEGQKIRVWLFVSWFFSALSFVALLGGGFWGCLVFQTWFGLLR
jgi:hypothetical protein